MHFIWYILFFLEGLNKKLTAVSPKNFDFIMTCFAPLYGIAFLSLHANCIPHSTYSVKENPVSQVILEEREKIGVRN